MNLPASWQIYNILNISRLEKWHGDEHPYEGPVIIPKDVEFETDQEYEVECILEHEEDQDGVLHYKVKWLGFDKPEDDTWEPAEHLRSARATVEDYWWKRDSTSEMQGQRTPTGHGQKQTTSKKRKRQA